MTFYDLDGKPTDAEGYGKCVKDKIISQEEVRKGSLHLLVSTVWLGINHRFGEGPPLIFETMVFDITEGVFEEFGDYTRRYATKEEAVLGHAEVMASVRVGS